MKFVSPRQRRDRGAPTARATASTGSSRTSCGTWKVENAPLDSHLTPGLDLQGHVLPCAGAVKNICFRETAYPPTAWYWHDLHDDISWYINRWWFRQRRGSQAWKVLTNLGYLGDSCLELGDYRKSMTNPGDLVKIQWHMHQKFSVICFFFGILKHLVFISRAASWRMEFHPLWSIMSNLNLKDLNGFNLLFEDKLVSPGANPDLVARSGRSYWGSAQSHLDHLVRPRRNDCGIPYIGEYKYPYAPWCWNIYQHSSHKWPKCRQIYTIHGAYGIP